MDLIERLNAPDLVIFSHQRSGTHFLQASLASHPEIDPRGEIVLKFKKVRDRLIVNSALANAIRSLTDVNPGRISVGIVMYSQLELFEKLFGSLMNFKVIHLTRNPAHVARSLVQMQADKAAFGARYRAHYSVKEAMHSPAPISEIQIQAKAERIMLLQRFYASLIEGHPDALTVSYESLCQNRQVNQLPDKSARQLLEFIDIPYQVLTNTLQKTGSSLKTGAARPPGVVVEKGVHVTGGRERN